MTSLHHPSAAARANLRLYGRRVVLRPLFPGDFYTYQDVRLRNEDWLLPWEPSRLPGATCDRRLRQLHGTRRAHDVGTSSTPARDRLQGRRW